MEKKKKMSNSGEYPSFKEPLLGVSYKNDNINDENSRATEKKLIKNKNRKPSSSSISNKKAYYKKKNRGNEGFFAQSTSFKDVFDTKPPGFNNRKEISGSINYNEDMDSSGFFNEKKVFRMSDLLVYSTVPFVESFFNASSGGVIMVLILFIIIYVFVSFTWALLLSIDSIDNDLKSKDFSAAIAPLSFIIAIITRDWIDGAGKRVIKPVTTLYEYIETIVSLNKTLTSIYRSKILELLKIMTSGDKIVDYDESMAWSKALNKNAQTNTTLLQLLTRYSVAIFKKKDESIEYQKYGVTSSEINYAENTLMEKSGLKKGMGDALNISDLLMQRISDSINAISAGTSKHMPKMDATQSQILSQKMEDLNKSLRTIKIESDITEPTLFKYAYVLILMIFLGFMLPIDIYSNIGLYVIIFCPLIAILYTIPLIFTWYVGSPFDDFPRWVGPDFEGWRKRNYKTIRENEKKIAGWSKEIDNVLEKYKIRVEEMYPINPKFDLIGMFKFSGGKRKISFTRVKMLLEEALEESGRVEIIKAVNVKEGERSITLKENKNRKSDLKKNLDVLLKIEDYIHKSKKIDKEDPDYILNNISESLKDYIKNYAHESSSSSKSSENINNSTRYRYIVMIPDKFDFFELGIIDTEDLNLRRN